MPARPFARRSGFVQSKRRLTQWVGSAPITAVAALAANTVVLDQSLVLLGLPATVIRTRGIITIISDQVGASEAPFGAVGFSVVSDQAQAVGITAIPDPISDSGSDLFFVHQYFDAPLNVGTAASFANISKTFAFDSKAMRKVSEDQTIVVSVANSSATAGLQYILQFRMLLKVN